MQKQGCVLLHFQWKGRSADLPSLTGTPVSRPGHHSAPMDLLHLIVTSRGHNLDLAIVGITFCAPTSLSPQCFLFPPVFLLCTFTEAPVSRLLSPPITHPPRHPYSVELLFIYRLPLSLLALLLSVFRIPSPSFTSPPSWTQFNEVKVYHLRDENRDFFFNLFCSLS